MSRREKRIVIDNEKSRDNGKVFIATEMSPYAGWDLSQELFRIMGQGGFNAIPDDVVRMGCAGLATLGMSVISAASTEAARKLRDDMMSNVKISITHEGKELIRDVDGKIDFEEIETIRIILDAVFEMNFSFLTVGGE